MFVLNITFLLVISFKKDIKHKNTCTWKDTCVKMHICCIISKISQIISSYCFKKFRVLMIFYKFEVLHLPSTGSTRMMHLSCIMLTVQPVMFITLLLYYKTFSIFFWENELTLTCSISFIVLLKNGSHKI